MPLIINNEYGNIKIENEAIACIAGLSAVECCGIVGMASRNVKDGIVKLLKRESLSKGIKINIDDNKVSIDLHIIVEYGTNISAITETLLESVKYKVEEFVGLEVENINIFVEGIRNDS